MIGGLLSGVAGLQNCISRKVLQSGNKMVAPLFYLCVGRGNHEKQKHGEHEGRGAHAVLDHQPAHDFVCNLERRVVEHEHDIVNRQGEDVEQQGHHRQLEWTENDQFRFSAGNFIWELFLSF